MKKLFFFFSAAASLVFFFEFVFSGRLILPQSFSLGSITIRYYGLIIALAVAGGFYLAKKRAPEYGIGEKNADDIIFWLIIGGFVGARLYHVLSSYSYYYSHSLEIFQVWHGGLSIYGAVLGGLFAVFICLKLFTKHYSLNTILNWLTPSLLLGQIIGRFGNLFNYEAFGYSTNLPWKMFVPLGFRPVEYQNFAFYHPWFLYEQLGLLVIFLVIIRLGKSGKSALFLVYLLLYNILRFGLEFLRNDSTFVSGFRLNSVISFLLIIISSGLIIRTYLKKNNLS